MNREMDTQGQKENERQCLLEAQHGNRAAIERVTDQYSALIVKMALRLNACTQSSYVREELIQAGYVGLLRAVEHYAPHDNASFCTYAFPWIVGEMKKALKAAVNHTGSYEGIRRIRHAQFELEAEKGREATIVEIAERCGMPLWQTAILINLRGTDRLYQEADDRIDSQHAVQRDAYDAAEWKLALDALPEAERQVIMLRYFRDLNQMETANALGKSQTQVSRIENRAMDRLRAWFSE